MVVFIFILCIAAFALLGGLLFINSIVVFNTIHYMAVAPSMLWRDTDYVRNLPNLLKVLYDAGLASPWPHRPTALSAILFRRRLHRILRGIVPDAPRLVQQHLSLWAFVQLNRDELRQIIRKRQMQRARRILAETLDADTRSQVLTFLNRCVDADILAARKCPPATNTTGTVNWLARLRSFDILLREHGYHISEEFSTLERWDDADDDSILEELSLGATITMNSGRLDQGRYA